MEELLTKPAIHFRHMSIAPSEMKNAAPDSTAFQDNFGPAQRLSAAQSFTPSDDHEARPRDCGKPTRLL
jgi:hypothetical protein